MVMNVRGVAECLCEVEVNEGKCEGVQACKESGGPFEHGFHAMDDEVEGVSKRIGK